MEINKTYPGAGGGLNADDVDMRISADSYINMQDFRFGSTDTGSTGILECVGSTVMISNPNKPAGNNICIRGAVDRPNRRAILCYWNNLGNHSIFCFDYVNNRIDPVLLNSQVTGGLGFDQFHLVDGKVENGCFYWTDNLNQPRRINIQSGLEMNMTLSNLLPGYTINTQYLPVNNVDLQTQTNPNWLPYTFQLPINVAPSWGSGFLQAKMFYTGTGGSAVGPNELPIFINSVAYPADSAASVVAAGVVQQLSALSTDTNWQVYAENYAFTVRINKIWDFGTGDTSYAPNTALNILIQYALRPDGSLPQPYNGPVSQSVIAWIRRQPGLPPTQIQAIDSPVPTVNFIANEATQYCYRYQYQNDEYSALSGLSNTAGFDEQDPPPTLTSLNVQNTNLVTNGYLATNMLLPTAPTPAYGTGVQAYIQRQGSGGANAATTNIPIPLNWTDYLTTKSYNQIIVEGLNTYFSNLPGNGNMGGLTAGGVNSLPQSVQQSGNWYISYRDGQHPTLNIKETWDWGIGDNTFPPTTLANLYLFTETAAQSKQYNRVDVSIPFGETIDQDVIEVDLVCNFLTSNTYSIIRTWKTSIPADAEAIANHNNGTAPLSYSFYNNESIIALDPTYAVKPFDSVPIQSKTIEMAKNLGWMGDYTIGYTSSNLTTSLATNFNTQVIGSAPGTAIIGEWFLLNFVSSKTFTIYSEYILQTTTPLSPMPFAPYYYYTTAGAAPPFPATISTGLIFLGTTTSQAMTYYINQRGDKGFGIQQGFIDQEKSSALQSENTTLAYGVISKVFKQNSSYQLSISFLDNAGQKSGIITNSTLQVNIPNTGFSQNEYVTVINWVLSNLNAQIEIPLWAYYYSINITKCLRTRFFVEAIGFATYAELKTDGTYDVTQLEYSTDFAGIAIDISFLNANGMGYVFTQGDVMNFTLVGSSTNYSASVVAQFAKYLIIQLSDIGQLGSNSLVLYEIYTPYQTAAGIVEPQYEIGQIFPVVNPGTSTRTYSVTQGTIGGDVYLFQRINFSIPYFAEAMSPNDKLYQYWFTDAGRPNEIDYIGQVKKLSSVAWSNTFIAGSEDNGLSTFDALDTQDLSPDFGAIMKLQLASKVSKIGTVMLAICSGPSVVSLYLEEISLQLADGSSTLGQSDNVIGSVHELKGDRGTLNLESIIEYKGNIYGWDIQNGKVWQYADNGIFDISNYKLSRMAKLFSDQYKSMTQAQIAALGNVPFIIGAVDPHHEELLFTIPQTLAVPPKGYLPDYPETVFPFDIWDGQGKTLSFSLKADPNKWIGSYSFTPEYMFDLEDNLFLVKNGDLYVGNSSASYCNYFGTQYQPKVMPVFNKEMNIPKAWNNCSVEANFAPLLAYFMSLYPFQMSTDLITSDFQNVEGVFYAPLYNNKLDPKYLMNFPKALISGEKVRTANLYGMFVFDATQGLIQIRFLNLGYSLSEGQKLGRLQM